MSSVVLSFNICLLHACLSLWKSGKQRETKTERLTEMEGSEKGRSENQNLAHVQSLCFMLCSLWKSEGLTGSQIWSDGGRGGGHEDKKKCNRKHQMEADKSKRQTDSIKHQSLFLMFSTAPPKTDKYKNWKNDVDTTLKYSKYCSEATIYEP